ncbi:hypothetical protein [Mycoavidus sp. B2-EB]|uniref:hypothetical protein n=1 Tax=Mycoavidus sp. B2-EB TaxID=2651972 RepID=UPI001E30E237|nr:hypothetical protein [Mycoavidus sp. B2-EB]
MIVLLIPMIDAGGCEKKLSLTIDEQLIVRYAGCGFVCRALSSTVFYAWTTVRQLAWT